MSSLRKHRLVEIEWPTFGACEPPARANGAEFESRIAATRAGMDKDTKEAVADWHYGVDQGYLL